jgi:TolA-binding protein
VLPFDEEVPSEDTAELELDPTGAFDEPFFTDEVSMDEIPQVDRDEGLVMPSSEDDDDDMFESIHARGKRNSLRMGLLAIGFLGAALGVPRLMDAMQSEPPEGAPAAEDAQAGTRQAPVAPVPELTGPPREGEEVPDDEAVTTDAEGAEAGAASPDGARASGTGGSTEKLVDQGWTALNKGRLGQAKTAFSKAIDRDPNSSQARFGLGYLSEKQGDEETAFWQYCMATNHAKDAELKREIEGRLGQMGRACDD